MLTSEVADDLVGVVCSWFCFMVLVAIVIVIVVVVVVEVLKNQGKI